MPNGIKGLWIPLRRVFSVSLRTFGYSYFLGCSNNAGAWPAQECVIRLCRIFQEESRRANVVRSRILTIRPVATINIGICDAILRRCPFSVQSIVANGCYRRYFATFGEVWATIPTLKIVVGLGWSGQSDFWKIFFNVFRRIVSIFQSTVIKYVCDGVYFWPFSIQGLVVFVCDWRQWFFVFILFNACRSLSPPHKPVSVSFVFVLVKRNSLIGTEILLRHCSRGIAGIFVKC